jgi:hypothetical protein
MRVPQSGQNEHKTGRPESLGRVKVLSWPRKSVNASLGTIIEMLNAPPVAFWHCVQWQMPTRTGAALMR